MCSSQRTWRLAIVDEMKKKLATGIALVAAVCMAGRLTQRWAATRCASSAPPSIPIVRAMWPEAENIRQLASRCRWRDLLQSRGRPDPDQNLGQRVTGERADDVAGGRVLGQMGERATG